MVLGNHVEVGEVDYHDVLAELGVGSAHPGGSESTHKWMSAIALQTTDRVLDVGCGTGKTACAIAQKWECEVTAVDVRPRMIERTKLRAANAGVEVQARVASAERLPFPDERFDLVVTESVNVFLNAERSLAEYFRVLQPGGTYIDVEMFRLGPATDEWKASVREVYGARLVPDLAGWKKLYQAAGFHKIETLLSKSVNPNDAQSVDNDPQDIQLMNQKAFQNPRVLQILQQNSQWLEANHRTLGYAIFRCRKPDIQA